MPAVKALATAKYTYSVRTWDGELEAYTPQVGMESRWEGLTLWQLKAALKELQGMGYTCHRKRGADAGYWDNDTSVLVERSDEQTDGTR